MDARGRRIGRVHHVVVSSDPRMLDAVVVRSGVFRQRLSLLSPDRVTEVIPMLDLVVVDTGLPSVSRAPAAVTVSEAAAGRAALPARPIEQMHAQG